MNAALREIGARRIALITPYLDAVNDQLKTFLDPEIAIEVLSSFRAETVDELAAITPLFCIVAAISSTVLPVCWAMISFRAERVRRISLA